MHVADENSALQTDNIQIFCLFACLFIFAFLTINSSATKQNRKMERQLPCPAAQSKRDGKPEREKNEESLLSRVTTVKMPVVLRPW
jgi:hypothetical protein